MNIPRFEYKGPSVVVLGAGATRGAQFVSGEKPVLPPLDADFFVQAQRLPVSAETRLLLKNTVSVFGINFSLTMEGFLTHIEHLSNVLNDYKQRGRPEKNVYRSMRENLLQVLASILHAATSTTPDCNYHKRLVELLETKDTVLSFNYDCTIDYSLKKHGSRKWNAEIGYGPRCYRKSAAAWNPTLPPKLRTVLLLKMHGSLNWGSFTPENSSIVRIKLKQRWWRQHGNTKFEIVPPEWNKETIRQGAYKIVWRKARERIRNCTSMAFIGYSLPLTDLPAQALFRVDAERAKKLELLTLVNPDRDARRRIREVLRQRIDSATRVLVFDKFSEYSKFCES